MSAEQLEHFQNELEIDFAISEPGVGRFRAAVFHQRGYPALVLRYISVDTPKLDELGLPDTLSELAMLKRGLVLMVGATGSGKSTTLAAMINHRNENCSDHILTIEDPIEFLHQNQQGDRQPARGRARYAHVRTGTARRDARGAGRHPDRRNPRPRDDGGRDYAGRHRPPVHRDAARQQLRRDAGPHHQHVPARPAHADLPRPVAVPARDRLAAPGARPQQQACARRSR